MAKNRIKDLQNNFINHEHDETEVHNGPRHSTIINLDQQSPVTDFLQETDLIRSDIDQIDELAQRVKRIHTEMLQPLANPKLKHELDDKTEEIKKLAYETSTALKKMEQGQENRDDLDKSNAQRRIKESQLFVLIRRFRDTMARYNQATVSHQEKCKKIIICELEISGYRKSNEELEAMLENGFPGTFTCSILVDTHKAKVCYDEIEARHHDILQLEKSIKELHNMYHDLAMLVTDQGQLIDNIEHNVAKAADYVEDAVGNVIIAGTNRKKITQKQILIFILVFTSLVLILIMILGYFTQKKMRGR